MEIGEVIITRIAVQPKVGLALACLRPEEKLVAEWMVEKGILIKTQMVGVVFLKLVPRPGTEHSVN